MKKYLPSRREILQGSAAVAATAFAAPVRAAAPPAEAITPALIEAAKKEGQVVWYTSADLQLAEKIAKAFEQKFPGISARVERAGAERIFTRVGQEYAAGLHKVDASNTGDAAMFADWKKQGLLEAYVPEDVAKNIAPEYRDADGYYAIVRSTLCIIAYNTSMVTREEAPKSLNDLLDPKWVGKLVKANPSYSGTIITSTYQLVRNLGWSYLEKLSKQKVMQVQSATDTPKKVILGERPVMVDGNEYNVLIANEGGKPIAPVYASEGSPIVLMPSAIFKAAPHPNAARLFQNYLFTAEAQQMFINVGGLRSVHRLAKDKPGRTPLSAIKIMNTEPDKMIAQAEEIKQRYSKYFGV
ncbi:MAG: extracellular solute-binding protein [Pseudolabrys sp.]